MPIWCVFLSSSLQSIEAGLSRITPSMDGSAALLGLSKLQILKRVHVPLLKRSIITAGLFVFVDVMKELPATLLLRPFNFDTLAVAPFSWLPMSVLPNYPCLRLLLFWWALPRF